ncbi:hypothetical protein [Nostoc sp.]|uniref:hypothetical protein n=1 Tax=Nostoc sp. TaxID=1180 RepID=UPI002FFC92F6
MQADALTMQADALTMQADAFTKQADTLTMQADALLLHGIAKFNSLRINKMLYLVQNLVNHPVRLGSITAPE